MVMPSRGGYYAGATPLTPEEEALLAEEAALLAAGGSPAIYEGTEPVPTPNLVPYPAPTPSSPAVDASYAAGTPVAPGAAPPIPSPAAAVHYQEPAATGYAAESIPSPYAYAAAEPYGVSGEAIRAGGDPNTLRSQDAYGPPPSSAELASPAIYEGTEAVPTPNLTAYPEVGAPYTPLRRRTDYPEVTPPYTPLQSRPRRNTGGRGTLKIPAWTPDAPIPNPVSPLRQAAAEWPEKGLWVVPDTIARYLGADPNDPNIDVYNQLARDFASSQGQNMGITIDTLQELGDLARSVMTPGTGIRSGQTAEAAARWFAETEPGLEARAQNIKQSAEDVFGPGGWILRQLQSNVDDPGARAQQIAQIELGRALRDELGGIDLPTPSLPAADLPMPSVSIPSRGPSFNLDLPDIPDLPSAQERDALLRRLAMQVLAAANSRNAPQLVRNQAALVAGEQLGQSLRGTEPPWYDPVLDVGRRAAQAVRTIDVPEPSLPAFAAPDVSLPQIDIPRPDVSLPAVSWPDIPAPAPATAELSLPTLDASGALDAARQAAQRVRTIDIPRPSLPQIGLPGLPDINLPDIGLPERQEPPATVQPPLQPGDYAGSTNPQTPEDWQGVTKRSLEVMLGYDKPGFTAQTEPRAVTLEDGSTRQVIAVKGMDDAKNRPYIVGVVQDGVMTPVGSDTSQAALKDLLATADEATVDAAIPATGPAALAGETIPTPATTPLATDTGTSSTRASGSGRSGSSGGGESYERTESRSRGGYEDGGREMRVEDFLRDYDDDGKITDEDRRQARLAFSRYQRGRRQGSHGGYDQGAGGMFWPGFPFNRPPSPMRQHVLAALAESMGRDLASTGRRR